MNSNNALTQPRAALDSLLNINTSVPVKPAEKVTEASDKKPFDAHMADQAERKPLSRESDHRDADQTVDDQPVSEEKTPVVADADGQQTEVAEEAVADSENANAKGEDAETVKDESQSPQLADEDAVATEEGAELVASGAEAGATSAVIGTENAIEKTTSGEGVNRVPLNGGVLARSRPSETIAVPGLEIAEEATGGKPLPSVIASVAFSVASTSDMPQVAAANGQQATVTSVPAQQNPLAGVNTLSEEAPLSPLTTEADQALATAKESSRPAVAVATQLSMAAAKTPTVSETTLLAQAVNNAVEKVAVPANVAEKVDQNLIKPTTAPRLIAPAVTKYQLDGQPSVTQTRVNVPVGQPQWPSAVAERVMWMSSQRVTSAEIHLDPPELGPLQVRVTVNQEAASVTFSSQHAAVREALDLGAFRLREMFEAEGMNLANVDVSDQSLAQGSDDGETGGSGQGGAGGGAEEGEEVTAVSAISSHDGLVDHYV